MLRDLALEEGGFASAEDADTDGVEGLTYTWTEEDDVPEELLHPFEHGRFIIRGALDPALRARLFEERELRRKPLRDDKAIASWNGLALAALAEAGRRLGRDDYLDAARSLGEFLLGPLSTEEGRLYRSWRAGQAKHAGARITPMLRTAWTSSTSQPESCAGSKNRGGSQCLPSISSATPPTAASSSRRGTARSSSRGRRTSTRPRLRRETRCSPMCCFASPRSGATMSSGGRRSASSGSSLHSVRAPRPRSDMHSTRSIFISR